MKITSPYFLTFLAIVLYSVSMLVYGTLSIFHGDSANDISAFGSILGGVGAFLGGIVAIFIFYGWKEQHNAQIKSNYIQEILKTMRSDLIKMAPIISKIIEFGDEYLENKNINFIEINKEDIDELYASHRTIDLIFKEYYLSFKDDDTYLTYIKYSAVLDMSFRSLIELDKISEQRKRLKYLTEQKYIIKIPSKILNKEVCEHESFPLTSIENYRLIDIYYFKIIDRISNNNLQVK